MRNDFEELKNAIIKVCVQILDNEELRQLVEEAQTIDEIVNILNSNSLTLSQKQIESYKLFLKSIIDENPYYGPVTKNVFVEILNSDIGPKEMIQRFIEYTSINDVRN